MVLNAAYSRFAEVEVWRRKRRNSNLKNKFNSFCNRSLPYLYRPDCLRSLIWLFHEVWLFYENEENIVRDRQLRSMDNPQSFLFSFLLISSKPFAKINNKTANSRKQNYFKNRRFLVNGYWSSIRVGGSSSFHENELKNATLYYFPYDGNNLMELCHKNNWLHHYYNGEWQIITGGYQIQNRLSVNLELSQRKFLQASAGSSISSYDLCK